MEYANHKKFGSKAGIKGSPVRIFTNIEKSSFVLPKKEGYKYVIFRKIYSLMVFSYLFIGKVMNEQD